MKALVHVAKNINRYQKPHWNKNVPHVLVRITEIPEGYGPIARARERITQYNNTQNTVRISDFRSNDAVQNSLKEQFSSISRKGKKVAYLPKRTDRTVNNTEVVRLEEFAKAVYTFLYEFVSFSGSTSFLFDDGPAGGYIRVFGDGNKLWERMPEEEFRLRAAIYWVSNEVSTYLRDTRLEENDLDARAALERKWPLVYAVSVVVQFSYENEWRAQISRLYKGDWTIGNGKKGILY